MLLDTFHPLIDHNIFNNFFPDCANFVLEIKTHYGGVMVKRSFFKKNFKVSVPNSVICSRVYKKVVLLNLICLTQNNKTKQKQISKKIK